MFETQVKLASGAGAAVTYKPGQWAIAEVRLPLIGNLFAHNFFILKDPSGYMVAELNGLATSADGSIKAIGYLPSDRLIAYVNTSQVNRVYFDNYAQEVVKSGDFDQIMASWRAGEAAGVLINSSNLDYPFMGLGSNSNSVATTIAAAMGVTESVAVSTGSILPTPGVGNLLLSTQQITDIRVQKGVTNAATIPNSVPVSLLPNQVATAALAHAQLEYSAGSSRDTFLERPFAPNGVELVQGGQNGELTVTRRYFTDNTKTVLSAEIFLERIDGEAYQTIINYNPNNGVGQCTVNSRQITEAIDNTVQYIPWDPAFEASLAFLPASYRTSSGYQIPLGDPFPGVDDYGGTPPVFQQLDTYALTIDLFNQYTSQTHQHYCNQDDPQFAYDWDGTGMANPTNWVGAGEVLIIDKRQIANGKPGGVVGGLAGLRALDSNHDGVFNSSDAQWANFAVWLGDRGYSPSTGLQYSIIEFADLGIVSINVAGTSSSPRDGFGNVVESTVTFQDGSTAPIRDSWFTYVTGPGY